MLNFKGEKKSFLKFYYRNVVMSISDEYCGLVVKMCY